MRGIVAALACTVLVVGCDPGLPAIGTPCVPSSESDPAFLGFDPGEVVADLPYPNADPGEIVCLVNHFRGRVTCPYGQGPTGAELPRVAGATGGSFPNGVGPCTTPNGPVIGDVSTDPQDGAQVYPQCADRRSDKTVTWSCRCANADGKTDDGARYCSCPSGTKCSSFASPACDVDCNSQFYCVTEGMEYQAYNACTTPCDPYVTTCF